MGHRALKRDIGSSERVRTYDHLRSRNLCAIQIPFGFSLPIGLLRPGQFETLGDAAG